MGLVALLATASLYGYSRTNNPSTQSGAAPADTTPPIRPLEFLASDTLILQAGPLLRSIDVSGPLVAVNQATAKARVAGELVELSVREGDAVQAGQVIGRIDNTEAIARQKERKALLASAQAQLSSALKNLENNRNLFEKGFVSQTVVDNAMSNADVAAAQRDAAKAQLDVVEKQLGDTRVLAPVTGQVSERLAQPGEKLSMDARIVTVVDTRQLELQAALPAAEVGRVRIGQSARLTVEGLAEPRQARVGRISPAAIGGSRSVPVFIALDGQDKLLRPGLYARGSITLSEGTAAIAVPKAAVRDLGGRLLVYRLDADQRLRGVPVKLGAEGQMGPNGPSAVEVIEGLSAGDRIVAVNLGTLRDGAPATLLPQP